MTRTTVAAALLSALALAACGSDDKPQPAKAAAAAATPFPSVIGGNVAGGKTYATREFKPSIALTPSDGEWKAVVDDGPAHFGIAREAESQAGSWLLAFHRMEQVFDPEKGGKMPGDAVPAPADFGKWIESHPRLKVDGPRPVQVLGREGRQYDVTTISAPKSQPDDCGKSSGNCVPMFVDSVNTVWFSKDEKVRLIVVDDPDGKEIVIEQYIRPGRTFDEAMAALEPTLDSARFAGS